MIVNFSFLKSNQKLLDAYEEQNIDAYTDSVSGMFSAEYRNITKVLTKSCVG